MISIYLGPDKGRKHLKSVCEAMLIRLATSYVRPSSCVEVMLQLVEPELWKTLKCPFYST